MYESNISMATACSSKPARSSFHAVVLIVGAIMRTALRACASHSLAFAQFSLHVFVQPRSCRYNRWDAALSKSGRAAISTVAPASTSLVLSTDTINTDWSIVVLYCSSLTFRVADAKNGPTHVTAVTAAHTSLHTGNPGWSPHTAILYSERVFFVGLARLSAQ